MKKKLVSLLFVGTLTLSMLTGCSLFPPTAESLMQNAFGNEEVTSGEMGMKIVSKMTISGDFLGSDINLGMDMKMDMDVEFDEDTTYTSGDVDVSFMGMSMAEKTKAYTQKDKDVVKTYTLTDDVWYLTTAEIDEDEKDDENTDAQSFKSFVQQDISIYKDLVLKETEKEDTEYVVTATVDFEDVNKLMDMSELMESMGTDVDIDWDEVSYNVTAKFDKKTRLLKEMNMEVDTEELKGEGFSIDEMSIVLTVKQLNDVEVEVPEDVIDEAVEYEEPEYSDIDISFDMSDVDEEDIEVPDGAEIIFEEEDNENDKDAESESAEINDVAASDWSKGEITFNGSNVQLRSISLQEFVELSGYVVNDSSISYEKGYVLNPEDYVSVSMGNSDKDFNTSMYVRTTNVDDEVKDVKECIVTGISLDIDWCIQEGTKYRSMSVGGIEIGKAVEDVTAVLGEPESTYSSNGYTQYSYEANHVYLDIEVNSDNVVTGLSITCY